MAFNDDGAQVLLTEGKNDCHLISALCQYYQLPKVFGLNECGSDELALRKLSALIASSEPKKTIGIVLDADNPSLTGKWAAVKGRLENENYIVPEAPTPGGTIVEAEGKAKIGIWLMPDNSIDGMLEDFCAKLAPEEAIEYANECIINARERGISTYKDVHTAKAKIHTFLAWQDEPGMPLGQAVSARALDPRHPIAGEFKDFLLNLFARD